MATRSEFQFWTGSIWKTALNLTFNAMTSFEIEENLSNPKVANVRLNNAADEPFGSTTNKQVGPFSVGQTDELTEFQRVRIFHPDTGTILFYGKIYRLENVYTPSYGEILQVTAYDNLKELADYVTDDKDTPFVLKNKRRSTVIQEIINDTSSPRHESTLGIPATNINTNPGVTIFEGSLKVVRDADGEGNIYINTGRKKALGVLLGISQLDPHSSSGAEDDFGYDFHVSDRFNLATSTGNHIPAQDFNYFKRGSRPATLESNVANYKGLHLKYPTVESFDESGITRIMLPTYNFERDSEEIYTEGLINTSEQVKSDGGVAEVRTHLRIEMIEVSSISGSFRWEGKNFETRNKDALSTANVAEEIAMRHTHGGSTHDHIIGRVQYQSATSGTGYLLISFQSGSAHFENWDTYITGNSALQLIGQQTVVTCNITPSTGRFDEKYSIRRPFRVKRNTQSGADGLRRDIFIALTKGKTQTIRGNLRKLGIPTTYVDTYAASESGSGSSAIPTLAITPADYGFNLGMTIAKIDAGGDVTAYGYASAINGDAVTATLNTGNWDNYTGASNKIRLYMPIRAGHYLYATNQLQHIDGYQFINSVMYSEGEGIATSNFKTQGTQAASPYNVTGLGLKPNAISSSVSETVAPIGALTDNIMKTGLPWTFIPDHATDSGIESTDYNTITIRAGVFQLANGLFSYNILAHTRDVTTADHIIYFAPDVSTTVFQFALKADYVPDNDHISIGWCKAVANTNGNEKAILNFNPGGVIGADPMLDGGFIAPSTINTTQIANNSITAAILKASSRPWTSNIKFTGTAWDAVQWNDGAGSPGNATLTFANSEAVTITAGSQGSLSAGNTYYAYIDGVTGTQAMETLSTTYTDAIGDAKILLAIITVGANANDGAKPAIFPFNSKAPTINAVVIAADAIQTDHMQANTISADVLTSGTIISDKIHSDRIQGDKLHITGSATFASGWRGGTGIEAGELSRTFIQDAPPNGASVSVRIDDIWIDSNDSYKMYKATINNAAAVHASSGWVLENANGMFEPEGGGGANVFSNPLGTIPDTANTGGNNIPSVAVKQYDFWLTSDTNQLYIALHASLNNSIDTGEWTLKDDADAINNATTSINGGLIKTQRIKLLKGGSSANAFETTLTTTANTNRLTDNAFFSTGVTTFGIDAWASGDLYIYPGDVIRIQTTGGSWEDMYVTSGSNTSLTVIRAWNSTSAGNINADSPIYKYNYEITTDPHIIMDNYGIVGYSDAWTPQFSLSSQDGKAMAGGGGVVLDSTGVNIGTAGGVGGGSGYISFHYDAAIPFFQTAATASLRAYDNTSLLWATPTTTTMMNWGAMHLQNIASLSSNGGTGRAIKLPTSVPGNGNVLKWVSSGGGDGSLASPYVLTWAADTDTWRTIYTTPADGAHGQSISAGWAYTHVSTPAAHHTKTVIQSSAIDGNTDGISSNWAFDHAASATAHQGAVHTHSTSNSYSFDEVVLDRLQDTGDQIIGVGASLIPTANISFSLGSNSYAYGDIYYYYSLHDTSDSRVKTNIADLTNTNALAFIDSLRPRTFNKLDKDGNTLDVLRYGLIAQEVEEALTGLSIDKTKSGLIQLPETETRTIVNEDGEEETVINARFLSYMELIAPLIGAVKALKARVDTLESA